MPFAQWVNVTHNKAAILVADGGWKTGGTLHLWISPGAGERPYEFSFRHPLHFVAGDPDGWHSVFEAALGVTERILGLRELPQIH